MGPGCTTTPQSREPGDGSSGAGSAEFYTVQGLPWSTDLGAEQSDGSRDPQALPRLGKFPCSSTQKGLILIHETGDGLHGRQESLAASLGRDGKVRHLRS